MMKNQARKGLPSEKANQI